MLPLLLSAILQAAAAAPLSAPLPFHDGDSKLTYVVPAGYVLQNELVQQAVQGEKDKQTGVMKAAVACVTVPLSAMDTRTDLGMTVLMKLDTECIGEATKPDDLAGLVTSLMKESLGKVGAANLQEPSAAKIGDHLFTQVLGTSKSDKLGVTFQGAGVCTISGKFVVCWEFLASSQDGLQALEKSTVQFDGEPSALPVFSPVASPTRN